MRQIILLVAFIVLALLCAAVLSFPVYKFLQIFTDIPFHKVTSQLSSLCGLVFIFLYLRFNGILNKTTAGFNLTNTPIMHDILTGMTAGIMIMLVLVVVLLTIGTHHLEPDLHFNLKFIFLVLVKAILSGVFVALIEETLYRGALLGGLSQTTNILTAVVLSSIIYAAVHFIKFPQVPANVDINWITGLLILSDSFYRFGDIEILDSFFALFTFGVLLALVRLNKGNIIQCMGLHAGVVFAIKIINELTDYVPNNNFEFLVSRHDHLLGLLATAWLFAIIVVYYRYSFMTKKLSEQP